MRHMFVAAAVAAASCGGTAPAQNPQSNAPQQFVIAVSTSGSGVVRGMTSDCRGSCTQRFDSGAKLVLQAVPDAAATFSGWSGACSGAGDCALTVSADLSVSATFATPAPPPPTPRHSLTVLVDGHGSVRSLPGGINCGPTCATTFDEGTAVTLTATPDSGYTFGAWSGACTGAGTCALSMGADTTVHARFDAIPPPPMVSLSISVTGTGSVAGSGINCSGSCSTQVAQGSAIVLTAHPVPGFRFMGFGGACSGQSCSFTIGGDASVTARFEQEVVQLASTNENAFGINSTRVFYWRYFNGVSGIWSVPKSGGTAVYVSDACCSVSYIVADDNYVYWTDLDHIYRAPVNGGFRQHLYDGFFILPLVLDGNQLYWTTRGNWVNYNTYQSGGVHVGNADGSYSTWLTTDAAPSGGLAVDSQYVYWTDAHAIGRVPKAGGGNFWPIRCDPCQPQVVRADFDNLYYRNLDGDTWSWSKATGEFHLLNTGEPRNNLVYQAVELDVNAKVAYWTWHDGTGSNMQGLFRANADGTGWTAIENSYDAYYAGPRVDDNYIFYIHDGVITRRLK